MSKIFLATCFSLDFDLPLLSHFIKHYIDLGVPPENFLFVLNVFKNKENLSKGMKILDSFGIFPKDIWCYEYESEEKWQRVHMILNKHVTPQDWVIHPDSDEFHEYPTDLRHILNICDSKHINAIQGFLIDRLTEDGKVKEIKKDENIFNQFPSKANLTKLIGISGVKLMAYKGYLRANNGSGQIHKEVKANTRYTHGGNECLSSSNLGIKILGNPHEKNKEYMPDEFNESFYQIMKMNHGFFVNHFKWHGDVIDKLEQRIETYKKFKRPQLFQSERLLDHYRKNGKFLFGEQK